MTLSPPSTVHRSAYPQTVWCKLGQTGRTSETARVGTTNHSISLQVLLQRENRVRIYFACKEFLGSWLQFQQWNSEVADASKQIHHNLEQPMFQCSKLGDAPASSIGAPLSNAPPQNPSRSHFLRYQCDPFFSSPSRFQMKT